MSDVHYGEAIELIRHGSVGDGVNLTYFQCRDLLHVIEDGQNEILTAQEMAQISSGTIHRLNGKLKDCEEGAISMGKELDRLGKVETLCMWLVDKMPGVEEFIVDMDLEDEADAYYREGGW